MAEEKKWEKWEGPGEPEGKGGISSPESAQQEEVAGRGRKLLATCFHCGTSSYIDADFDWFTCWNCGTTGVSMVA